jgi:hypothetical protein
MSSAGRTQVIRRNWQGRYETHTENRTKTGLRHQSKTPKKADTNNRQDTPAPVVHKSRVCNVLSPACRRLHGALMPLCTHSGQKSSHDRRFSAAHVRLKTVEPIPGRVAAECWFCNRPSVADTPFASCEGDGQDLLAWPSAPKVGACAPGKTTGWFDGEHRGVFGRANDGAGLRRYRTLGRLQGQKQKNLTKCLQMTAQGFSEAAESARDFAFGPANHDGVGRRWLAVHRVGCGRGNNFRFSINTKGLPPCP